MQSACSRSGQSLAQAVTGQNGSLDQSYADRLLKMRALARPPPLNDEHAGKVGGRLDERLELKPGVQHGVQVCRQHAMVRTDMTAHADRPVVHHPSAA